MVINNENQQDNKDLDNKQMQTINRTTQNSIFQTPQNSSSRKKKTLKHTL
jgi:hypothetical protein